MDDDFTDANQLIIEAVPMGGRPRRLLDQYMAAQIRNKIALALGLEDEALATKLAQFQREVRT
jgi:hypothetical protein